MRTGGNRSHSQQRIFSSNPGSNGAGDQSTVNDPLVALCYPEETVVNDAVDRIGDVLSYLLQRKVLEVFKGVGLILKGT